MIIERSFENNTIPRSRLENYEVTTVRVILECFQSLNGERKKRRALQYVHAREGIQTNRLGGTTPYWAAFEALYLSALLARQWIKECALRSIYLAPCLALLC